jgi:hypothetical protein
MLWVATVLVASSASTGATTPWQGGEPRLVQGDKYTESGAPTGYRGALAYITDSRAHPERINLWVRAADGTSMRINGPRTSSERGALAGDRVFYSERDNRDHVLRLMRYDLLRGKRVALPAKVNHRRHSYYFADGGEQPAISGVRGDVSASAGRVLYSGYTRALSGDGYADTVIVYDLGEQTIRKLAAADGIGGELTAGQIRGDYATYQFFDRYGGEILYRQDLRTGGVTMLPHPEGVLQWDPAVTADGTVYFIQAPDNRTSDGPWTYDLIRQPLDGPAEVVTTFDSPAHGYPVTDTFVRERADGARVVLVAWQGDIYQVLDRPVDVAEEQPVS